MIEWGLNPRGIFNLPLEYASARGVFGQGLKIAFHNHRTGAEYGIRLKACAFDIGQIGTPVYFPAVEGRGDYEIVTVGICNYPPFYLVAEPGVGNLSALRGATVAINRRGTCAESLLLWHLNEEGLSESDLRVFEVMAAADCDSYGAAFIKGVQGRHFKAGIIFEPFVTYLESVAGWKVIADYPRMVVPSNYCLLLYVRKAWADNYPDALAHLVADYFIAVDYARNHLEEMVGALAPLPYVSGSQLLTALRREVPLWNAAPLLDNAVLGRAREVWRQQGGL